MTVYEDLYTGDHIILSDLKENTPKKTEGFLKVCFLEMGADSSVLTPKSEGFSRERFIIKEKFIKNKECSNGLEGI